MRLACVIVLLCASSAFGTFDSNLLVSKGESIQLIGDFSGVDRIMQQLIDYRYPGREIHIGADPKSQWTVLEIRPGEQIPPNLSRKVVIASSMFDGDESHDAYAESLAALAAKRSLRYAPVYEETHRLYPSHAKSNLVEQWIVAQTILKALDYPFLIDPIRVVLPAEYFKSGDAKQFRLQAATPLDFLSIDSVRAASTQSAVDDLKAPGVYHVVEFSGPPEDERRRVLERELDMPGLDLSEARTFSESGTGKSIPYRFFKPENLDVSKKYPLVLYLHHAGEKGNDNIRQVHCDTGIGMLMLPEHRSAFPCFVVAPQVPSDKAWANMSYRTDVSARTAEPSDQMRMALEIIDKICDEFGVDRSRIYVTGTSLGGFGTWDAVSRRPHFFAAAIPTCGGYDENAAKLFIDTPIWTLHGNSDEIIKVDRTRHMVDAVRKAGGKIRYWELDGLQHETARDVAYSLPGVLEWMFAQHR